MKMYPWRTHSCVPRSYSCERQSRGSRECESPSPMIPGSNVHTSVNAARKSACATRECVRHKCRRHSGGTEWLT
jgi:hypothetical protein